MKQQEIEAKLAIEETKIEILDTIYESLNNHDSKKEVLESLDYHYKNIRFLKLQLRHGTNIAGIYSHAISI